MSARLVPHDIRYFETTDELRDWFDANHETAAELWLGHHKKASGKRRISWSESVDEALCVGWIDGIAKAIDDERYAQRFTPRRKGSNWSAVNVAKVESLIAQGRMRPAGLAAFAAREPEKTAVYSYERAEPEFDRDDLARFRADEAAWTFWETQAPSYRRAATGWVLGAKRPETRERRLATLIADSAAGRRPGPFQVGSSG